MELEVKRGLQSEYIVNPAALAVNDIFVDDLRPDNDPSLGVVPRIETYEQLVSVFKVGIATRFGGGETPPGEEYFKLVGWYVRSGVAAIIPKVLGPDGSPLPNILVFAHWPGAPALELPGGERPRPDYTDDGRGVAGFTNANGDIGFGYAGGAVIGDNGGPYTIWPAAYPKETGIRQHSDAALRIGWHGATDHLTPNPIFMIVKKPEDDPPPPPTTGGKHTLTQILLFDDVEIARSNTVVSIEATLRVT